jgi:hypothetical protein
VKEPRRRLRPERLPGLRSAVAGVCLRVLVRVHVLQSGLVHVRMRVAVAVVLVLVRVLDVVVVVRCVRVDVRLSLVLVLVDVWCVVRVIVGHCCSLWRLRLDGGWVGDAGAQVLDMAQRLVEQPRHVRIMQRIDHMAAGADADHEPEVAQDPQLMRDGWLLHLHRCREITDRALAEA